MTGKSTGRDAGNDLHGGPSDWNNCCPQGFMATDKRIQGLPQGLYLQGTAQVDGS